VIEFPLAAETVADASEALKRRVPAHGRQAVVSVSRRVSLPAIMQREGAEPVGNSLPEFAALINREIEKYARIVKTSGARPDA
jgi:hypothetical protein